MYRIIRKREAVVAVMDFFCLVWTGLDWMKEANAMENLALLCR
jgi:hypothetical protein